MDGGIGTRYEVDADGNYTGLMTGGLTYGEGKVEPIRAFAAEHDIDLAESWAYSDSASDLPMLRLVGNPVAVNPDAPLAAIAREEGWRIMRFEQLGRRLAAAGTVAAAGAVGAGGSWIVARRRAAEGSRR
jgi:phosphoserine phosphatase